MSQWARNNPEQMAEIAAMPMNQQGAAMREAVGYDPDRIRDEHKEAIVVSYKPEVFVQGGWAGNALRFATREEAQASVDDLARRWVLVESTRVVESDDPVNYRLVDGVPEAV